MEEKYYVTTCDVCGRKEKKSFLILLEKFEWTTYRIRKDWQSGAHKGLTDRDIIVCAKCDGKRGYKYYLKVLKSMFKKEK